MNKTRDTFLYIDQLYDNCEDNFYNRLREKFTGSHWYHLLLISTVLVPFLIIGWNVWPYGNLSPDSKWAWILDIYGYIILFFILILFSELLWLIINIVWALNDMGCKSRILPIKIDVFSLGMKLRPIRNFLLMFVVYYFISIAIAISTYIGPTRKFSYETGFFIVLLLFGIALFFAGMEAIQRMINCQVESELDVLNKKRDEQHKLLIDIISGEDRPGKTEEIDSISKILEILQNERDSLMQTNRKAYDITAIGVFIGSILIPLLTLLEKLGNLAK